MSDEIKTEPEINETEFHVAYNEEGDCRIAIEPEDARQQLEDDCCGLECRGMTIRVRIKPWAPREVEVTVPEQDDGTVEVKIT